MLANSFCLFGELDIDHVGNHFHLMSFLVNKHLTNWDHDYLEKQPALLGNKYIDQVGRQLGSPDFTAWLVCSWLTKKDKKINLILYVLSGQP